MPGNVTYGEKLCPHCSSLFQCGCTNNDNLTEAKLLELLKQARELPLVRWQDAVNTYTRHTHGSS